MNDDAEKFWSDFEAETGEKVEVKTIGTCFESPGDKQGVWGLLVLTDASFRFRHIPSENWLSSLFKPRRTTQAPARAIDLVVPRSDIVSLDEPRRGFMAKFLGPAFPRFTLRWREEGREKAGDFAADPSSDLLRRLRALASPAPQS